MGRDVVVVAGTARERGLQHGLAVHDEIHEGYRRWRKVVTEERGEPWEQWLHALVHESGFLTTARQLTPTLVEEVEGIAVGAGLDFDEVFAYQLADEGWWFRAEAKGGPVPSAGGCSVIGVRRESEVGPLLAQNMDLPDHFDGSQVALRSIYPDGLEVLVLTAAGMVGFTGMNSAGVGVCCNTLLALAGSATGLPVSFVLRALLEQRTAVEARRLLGRLPHASGQNYMVADRRELWDLECAPAGVHEVTGSATLVHTNHPLAAPGQNPVPPAVLENSRRRLQRLEASAGQVGTSAEIAELLGDRTAPLCVTSTPERRVSTFGSVIMEPAALRIDVSFGRPGATEWQQFDLR